MPTKRLLSPPELVSLTGLMRQAFIQTKALRDTNALAEWIQFPKVPSILSESLVVHLINRRMIIANHPQPQARLGGRIGDIIFQNDDTPERKAEVKASAREGFSEFVQKDILADYLIWVSFADTFLSDSIAVAEVLVVERPSRFFSSRTKMTLPRFKAIIGGELRSVEVNIASLVELVGELPN